MKKTLLIASAIAFSTFGLSGTASAADLNEQIDLCEAAIMETASAAFDSVDVDYRSQGGGQLTKKLQFTVRSGNKWGKTTCTIADTEVKSLKWPRSLRTQIAAAELAEASQVATAADVTSGSDK